MDAVAQRALARGPKLRWPASDFVPGDRYASILDRFRVRWASLTRVEDLSPEESAARVRRWAATVSS